MFAGLFKIKEELALQKELLVAQSFLPTLVLACTTSFRRLLLPNKEA
jgi:hypothetical protein